MQDSSAHVNPEKAGRGPSTGSFVILLITLWALNLADIFQTLYLKDSGLLAEEANAFINFFLREGHIYFIGAKILAMVLISLMLIRGWNSKTGFIIFRERYDLMSARKAINFLLSAGVIYYVLIVIFPFIAMYLSGAFTR